MIVWPRQPSVDQIGEQTRASLAAFEAGTLKDAGRIAANRLLLGGGVGDLLACVRLGHSGLNRSDMRGDTRIGSVGCRVFTPL